jgi:hypothetical protein
VWTVLHDSFAEAQRLGHQWVGPEHVLLAILDDLRPSVARTVLNELGATHQAAESWFLASLLVGSPAVRSKIADRVTRPAPIFYEIQGWIAGYGAATGTPQSAETALVCLCSFHPAVVSGIADARDVVEALAVRGVLVPSALRDLGEALGPDIRRIDVPIDKLTEIRGRLLDAGSLVGFNLDVENRQAWVIVDGDANTSLEWITAV